MRLACIFLLLLSCTGGPNPAEAATYNAIAPEYRAYVEADQALSDEQKQRRFRTLDRWAEALQVTR